MSSIARANETCAEKQEALEKRRRELEKRESLCRTEVVGYRSPLQLKKRNLFLSTKMLALSKGKRGGVGRGEREREKGQGACGAFKIVCATLS